MGSIWLADYLSGTWDLKDYFSAMGYIFLRECLFNQFFQRFIVLLVGSIFLVKFSVFNFFNSIRGKCDILWLF